MSMSFKPVITIFYCNNALNDAISLSDDNIVEMRSIRLPCSSMVKDIYLLKAYESGADAVVVITCPEGECHYVDGNIRARKRVDRVKFLLDEIGLGSQRLSLLNVSMNDKAAISRIIQDTVSSLRDIGPNPTAARPTVSAR